jgi:hypothetical protein
MKRYSILFALFLTFPGLIFAQNFADAFRMSNHQVQGTARSAGMGNAFGALGGDFTSLTINPAGSAIYQKGEFVVTPSYYINDSEMLLNGKSFSDNDQGFSLSNIGAIGSFRAGHNETGLININYGIGYNRLGNFSSNAFANYDQSGVSYLDNIADYANQEALSNNYLNQVIGDIEYRDWPSKLAWDTYLINPAVDENGNEIDGSYQSILYENEKVDQRKTYKQSGHIDEYVFNIGFNFYHKLYLGATLGLHDVKYRGFSNYEELLEGNNSYRFDDELYIDGNGFNLKFGAIYRPTQSVRLGLAFHTPTWYEIDDESVLSMNSQLQENHSSWGSNLYNYDFNSPLKVIFSGAVLFGKRGLLSVDAEYQNYEGMRFRRGGNGTVNFNDLNSEMSNVFNDVFNFRIGGEFKLTNQFTLRGGYEHYGNPFDKTLADVTSLTDDMSTISAGFGYSVNVFAFNVAYRYSTASYSEANVQPNYFQVARDNTNQNILMSFAVKF